MGLLLATFSTGAMALDWKVDPSISASVTVTDNGGQTSNGDASTIFSVTPAVSLTSEGSRRIRASAHYSLNAIQRFGDNNSNDLNHSLGANGNAEVIDDLFFIDASAGVSQALKSLLGAPGDSTLDTGNRTTVGTYSLSPYLTKRFGTFGTGLARYRHAGALFEDEVGGDINSDSFEASFASGTQFKNLFWGLNYSLREASTQRGEDTQFQRYSASLGYALTRKFRLNGSVGYDDNDYLSKTGTSGESWSVGFTWLPGRRTTLDASFGERYFGNTYALGLTHRARSTQWNIRYSEDVSDISQQLLNETVGAYWVCPAGSTNPANIYTTSDLRSPPPGLSNCSGPLNFATVRQLFHQLGFSDRALSRFGFSSLSTARGVYIIKSLNAGVAWGKGKLAASLNVHDTRRNYQEVAADAEDQSRGVSTSASYRLAPYTTMSASLSYDNNQVPALLSGLAGDRDDDVYTFSLGVNHQFRPKLNGSLFYRHQRRESSGTAADFAENSLTATVTMRF